MFIVLVEKKRVNTLRSMGRLGYYCMKFYSDTSSWKHGENQNNLQTTRRRKPNWTGDTSRRKKT